MSMSNYELECENLQPDLLKRKSLLSFKQAKKHLESIKGSFSKECINMYEMVVSLVFETNEKGTKNFEEIIKTLKDKELEDFKLECALEEVSHIYGMTFEEVRDFCEGKRYWMSISRLY